MHSFVWPGYVSLMTLTAAGVSLCEYGILVKGKFQLLEEF